MTVYKIGNKKIKITLTHGEVISFFGAYEKLANVSGDTRLVVGLLLRESLSDYENELGGDLIVEIKAKEHSGCVITVSSGAKSHRKGEKTHHMFEFKTTTDLIGGVTRLYVSRQTIEKSSLYKMPDTYRLLITYRTDNDFFYMNEFCLRQSSLITDIAYTEEYGELLSENAVKKIGKAFSKGF